jgi:hypothetical protein
MIEAAEKSSIFGVEPLANQIRHEQNSSVNGTKLGFTQ